MRKKQGHQESTLPGHGPHFTSPVLPRAGARARRASRPRHARGAKPPQPGPPRSLDRFRIRRKRRRAEQETQSVSSTGREQKSGTHSGVEPGQRGPAVRAEAGSAPRAGAPGGGLPGRWLQLLPPPRRRAAAAAEVNGNLTSSCLLSPSEVGV